MGNFWVSMVTWDKVRLESGLRDFIGPLYVCMSKEEGRWGGRERARFKVPGTCARAFPGPAGKLSVLVQSGSSPYYVSGYY